MKRMKRVVSWVLCLCLTVSLFSGYQAPVYAASTKLVDLTFNNNGVMDNTGKNLNVQVGKNTLIVSGDSTGKYALKTGIGASGAENGMHWNNSNYNAISQCTAGITLNMWIKVDDVSKKQVLFNFGTLDTVDYNLYVGPEGLSSWMHWDDTNNLISGGTIPAKVWTQITMTQTTAGDTVLYINGKQVASGNNGRTLKDLCDGYVNYLAHIDVPNAVGYSTLASTAGDYLNDFTGTIAEFSIGNGIDTAAEVLASYNAGAGKAKSDEITNKLVMDLTFASVGAVDNAGTVPKFKTGASAAIVSGMNGGYALRFGGSDTASANGISFESSEASPILQCTNGLTINTWIKPTDLSEKQVLFNFGYINNVDCNIYIGPDGVTAGTYWDDASKSFEMTGGRLTKDKWTQVSFTQDMNGYTIIYVDGVQVVAGNVPVESLFYKLVYAYNTNLNWYPTYAIGYTVLGSDTSDYAKSFKGDMAEFAMYNGVLSINEIARLTPNKAAPDRRIRVTCVGDSITYGIGVADANNYSYPSQMQNMLGTDDFVVTRCGASGAFACESKDLCWYPYITSNEYQASLVSNPDVVIIMLGTNDASEGMCWGKINSGVDVKSAFRQGYENLIKTYQNLASKPKVILATPLTVIENDNREVNNVNGTIPIIKELAEKYGLTLVDMHSFTANWTNDNYLSDGLHPNANGYTLLAEKFSGVIREEIAELDKITYDGKSIKGFSGDKNEYNVVCSGAVPEVDAKPEVSKLNVLIGQPTENNLSSKVQVLTATGSVLNTYAINFDLNQIRVTCVGDSITEGFQASSAENTYPSKLQNILGSDFYVFNAGVSAKTVIRSDGNAYNKTTKYTEGLQSKPDIVIIMLGTNDAVLSGITTAERKAEFKRDYAALIEEYQKCGTNPKIMLALPTKCDGDRNTNNENVIIPIIRELAKEYSLQVLETHDYTSTWSNSDYLKDGLHPNDAGYNKLAEFFATEINDYLADGKDYTVNEGVYTIVNEYNDMAITQTDLSSFWANCVLWNTDAMSDLARWNVKKQDDYYLFTNTATNKGMKITGSENGNNIDFNGPGTDGYYRWKLVPITTGEYEGCYYIVSSVTNSNGEEMYAEVTDDEATNKKDGAQVRVWTKADGYNPRQIWRIKKTEVEISEFTEEMNDQAVEAFRNQYFVYNGTTGYNSLGDGFWGIAEVMEAMLDGYETTGKRTYREMFEGTYNDFIARNGTNWNWNEYNDDISWAVLDSVRAYLMFGEQRYLDIAKENWDLMYARALKPDGLLIWKMNTDGGTTSCINGPATVAACYLGKATGDDSYYTKAKNIFNAWRNSTLYVRDGEDAGHVWDNPSSAWCSTYNQGTFIGAATMLYERYGDEMYYTDATNAMNAVFRYLCNGNILKEENTNTGDLSGFRGILVRYMRNYVVKFNAVEYLPFFKENAKVAWMNRNSKNIMQNPWQRKTEEEITWDEFAAYNPVSLMANMPTYEEKLERDAYSVIEAEDMDYTRGLVAENSTGTSGGRSLGGVNNSYYTAYYNVDFGDVGASKVKFKYSRIPYDQNGTVEFRLGSENGKLIASASIGSTGSWSDWKEITVDTEKVTGIQNVYVVFKADTEYVCNFDYFKFVESTNEATDKIDSITFNQQNGIVIDGDVVADTNNGDWLAYEDVLFDGNVPEAIEILYSKNGSDSCYEGHLEVYIDGMTGTPVSTIELNNTSIANWDTYVTAQGLISGDITEGYHTVYLKFVSTDNRKIANLSQFSFEEKSSIRNGFETIEAEEVAAHKNARLYGEDTNTNGYVGRTKAGSYTRYDSIYFSEDAKSMRIKYSSNAADAKGKVEVYVDAVDGTPVGSFDLTKTAEDNWDNYIEKGFVLSETIDAGLHTVYLKFIPDTSAENIEFVANVDSFIFSVSNVITSDLVKVKGYQISTTLGGNRVVGSVEEEIEGKKVVNWGFVYGLVKVGSTNYSVTNDDMTVSSSNNYVRAFESTNLGTIEKDEEDSDTCTTYVTTMLFASNTKDAFEANYKVRAYALLEDGSYVYSDIESYSIYDIAKSLYDNAMMKTYMQHEYLYNNILKVCDANYKEVEYDWGNIVAPTIGVN